MDIAGHPSTQIQSAPLFFFAASPPQEQQIANSNKRHERGFRNDTEGDLNVVVFGIDCACSRDHLKADVLRITSKKRTEIENVIREITLRDRDAAEALRDHGMAVKRHSNCKRRKLVGEGRREKCHPNIGSNFGTRWNSEFELDG